MILEGRAVAEVAGRPVLGLAAGSCVGSVDGGGRPVPAAGVTVRLLTRARVLVFDAARLAALIAADQEAADAWRGLAFLRPADLRPVDLRPPTPVSRTCNEPATRPGQPGDITSGQVASEGDLS